MDYLVFPSLTVLYFLDVELSSSGGATGGVVVPSPKQCTSRSPAIRQAGLDYEDQLRVGLPVDRVCRRRCDEALLKGVSSFVQHRHHVVFKPLTVSVGRSRRHRVYSSSTMLNQS